MAMGRFVSLFRLTIQLGMAKPNGMRTKDHDMSLLVQLKYGGGHKVMIKTQTVLNALNAFIVRHVDQKVKTTHPNLFFGVVSHCKHMQCIKDTLMTVYNLLRG